MIQGDQTFEGSAVLADVCCDAFQQQHKLVVACEDFLGGADIIEHERQCLLGLDDRFFVW